MNINWIKKIFIKNNNIILTGIPRSGTTLTCTLLHSLPNVVALQEPVFESNTPHLKKIIHETNAFFKTSREEIFTSKKGLSRHTNGQFVDNYLTNEIIHGKRVHVDGNRSFTNINKSLSKDFYLIVKRPSLFTALLPELKNLYRCYAIIRNPLSILASWATTTFTVSHGHAPKAEQVDKNLRQSLANINTVFDRQLFLIDWFFKQYVTHLSCHHIIKYEEMITTKGRVLSALVPEAIQLDEKLINKNSNPIYDYKTMEYITERLLSQSHAAYWNFYHKTDMLQILSGYKNSPKPSF